MNDDILKILLQDRTTNKNIIWATNDYENISETDEIKIEQINLIQPRFKKIRELQKNRTRNKAEIFTPLEICDKQNNLIDENFADKSFEEYINAVILEITCGEAPYIASRYDAVTGENILIKNRVGILDRKLKLVDEYSQNQNDWYEFAKKAVQSVYGYEFQGDNLFIARKNIFLTAEEFFQDKFNFPPYIGFMREIAEIISWNLWQMDGLNYSVPILKQPSRQLNLFEQEFESIPCKIFDWRENKQIVFEKLIGKGGDIYERF